MNERDRQPAPPVIKNVSMKIGALERRRTHLERQINERQGSPASLDYMLAEASALTAAELALTYHKNVVSRLDEPISVLRDLIAAYDGPAGHEAKLRAAVNRARAVVDEFEALMEKSA